MIYLRSERELKKAKDIRSLIERKLFVVGIITSELRKIGITPIVVGGSAVEFYTSGAYESLDIDLISKKPETFDLLKKMGFKNIDQHWSLLDYGIDLEIVGWHLSGSKEKLIKVNVDRYEAFLIGIEDLIVDRLCACKFWKSSLDYEQANVLLNIHKDEIDFLYLKDKAKKEEVIKELDEILHKM